MLALRSCSGIAGTIWIMLRNKQAPPPSEVDFFPMCLALIGGQRLWNTACHEHREMVGGVFTHTLPSGRNTAAHASLARACEVAASDFRETEVDTSMSGTNF